MTTNKTPPYRLRASANYERKMLKKAIRLDLIADADLIAAIDADGQSFNSLTHTLLREYYKLDKK